MVTTRCMPRRRVGGRWSPGPLGHRAAVEVQDHEERAAGDEDRQQREQSRLLLRLGRHSQRMTKKARSRAPCRPGSRRPGSDEREVDQPMPRQEVTDQADRRRPAPDDLHQDLAETLVSSGLRSGWGRRSAALQQPPLQCQDDHRDRALRSRRRGKVQSQPNTLRTIGATINVAASAPMLMPM